ncbi:hypothetical protein JOB18_033277 [Solea senegalensis]|uniref:Uncharacterized protein n=1 Tax=Solea senegalensis TaxID=28829 RepID=A0AAV6RVW8_SOLSE|nr:hypothetical protein JOB18_033277 [Solea senegalensis]
MKYLSIFSTHHSSLWFDQDSCAAVHQPQEGATIQQQHIQSTASTESDKRAAPQRESGGRATGREGVEEEGVALSLLCVEKDPVECSEKPSFRIRTFGETS